MPFWVLFHFNPNRFDREYTSSKYAHSITNAYRRNEMNNIVDVEHNTISSLPLPKGYLQYYICMVLLWFFINIYWSMRSCIVQMYIISLLSSGLLCMISNYIFLFPCWMWNKLLNNEFEIKSVNMLIFLQVFLQKWVLVVISFKYWYLRKAYTSTQIEN